LKSAPQNSRGGNTSTAEEKVHPGVSKTDCGGREKQQRGEGTVPRHCHWSLGGNLKKKKGIGPRKWEGGKIPKNGYWRMPNIGPGRKKKTKNRTADVEKGTQVQATPGGGFAKVSYWDTGA